MLAIEARRGLPEEVTFEWWPALREGPSGPRICRKRGPGRGSEGQGTKGGNEPGRLYKQTEGECGWGGVPGEGGRRWGRNAGRSPWLGRKGRRGHLQPPALRSDPLSSLSGLSPLLVSFFAPLCPPAIDASLSLKAL